MYRLEDKDLFIELLLEFSEPRQEDEHLLPFLTKGSEFRKDPNWTNGSLFLGDEDRFSVKENPTVQQGVRPGSDYQQRKGLKVARWASVHGEILPK